MGNLARTPIGLAALERRGRALREFCDRVRERGGVAVVEEFEDLPALRILYLIERAAVRARGSR